MNIKSLLLATILPLHISLADSTTINGVNVLNTHITPIVSYTNHSINSTKNKPSITLKKNMPFAAQVSKENTIYVIRYDFDLNDHNGKNPIIIPSGSKLEFKGGCLSNGTIKNVYLSNNPNYQIFKNCEVDIKSEIVKVIWFGADEAVNATPCIQQAVRACNNGCTLYFSPNHLYIHGDGTNPDYSFDDKGHLIYDKTNNPVDIGLDIRYLFTNLDNIVVEGNGCTVQSNAHNSCIAHNSLFVFNRCNNVLIRNITIDGNKNERKPKCGDPNGYNEQNNLRFDYCKDVTITDCRILNSVMDGVFADHTTNIRICRSELSNSYRNNITFEIVENGYVDSCAVNDAGNGYGTWPKNGIDLENDWGIKYQGQKNIKITNCQFSNNENFAFHLVGPNSQNIEVSYCSFLGTAVKCQNPNDNSNLYIHNNTFNKGLILDFVDNTVFSDNYLENIVFDTRNSGRFTVSNNIIKNLTARECYLNNCTVNNNNFIDFAATIFHLQNTIFRDNSFKYTADGSKKIKDLNMKKVPFTIHYESTSFSGLTYEFEKTEDEKVQKVIDLIQSNLYGAGLSKKE